MSEHYRIEGWSDHDWLLDPPHQLGSTVKLVRWDYQTTVEVPRRLLRTNANARATDPSTSWAAAAQQTPDKMRDSHRLVLRLLRKHGPANDFELARFAKSEGITTSQTSIGKRRLELVRLGMVIDSGTTAPSDLGCDSIRWKLTNDGKRAC